MSALTDLIAKWREEANKDTVNCYWTVGLRYCARELEAALKLVPFAKCQGCEYLSHPQHDAHCMRGEGDGFCVKGSVPQ